MILSIGGDAFSICILCENQNYGSSFLTSRERPDFWMQEEEYTEWHPTGFVLGSFCPGGFSPGPIPL